MKLKKLTKEQILISIDRLTRFKYSKDKYLRVYTDIILNNLIEPKYKKNEILNLSFTEIKNLAENIFNASLEPTNDYNINNKIYDYENIVFNLDKETQKLVNNHLNYKSALKYIDSTSPINLQWLKSLEHDSNLITNRELHYLKYPIEKVILLEWLTEEILLPAFSKFLGYDFYQKGIQVIGAGGKNQVVKMYYKLIEEIKLPIFLLLDRDAEDNIKQIQPRLRDIDKIHLVACGEFEDMLPKSLIIKTINNHLANLSSISEADLDDSLPEVKNLEYIFKTKGLHEFKKADFAKMIRNNINEQSDISREIAEIIEEISNKNKTLDSNFCSWYYKSCG
mgnify:CR=1 FL=1